MSKTNITINVKDLRKAAIAIGFGFTVGKNLGKLVNAGIDGITLGILEITKRRKKPNQKADNKFSVIHNEEQDETDND